MFQIFLLGLLSIASKIVVLCSSWRNVLAHVLDYTHGTSLVQWDMLLQRVGSCAQAPLM